MKQAVFLFFHVDTRLCSELIVSPFPTMFSYILDGSKSIPSETTSNVPNITWIF